MKNIILCFAILVLTFSYGYGQKLDTAEVYYELNFYRVSTMASMVLDSLMHSRMVESGKKTTLLGYADYLGSRQYNLVLSQKRADNVKEYLVASGLDETDIIKCEGRGKIDRVPVPGELGFYRDRQVMIITDHEKTIKPTVAAA